MSTYNSATIIGRLGQDVELRYTSSDVAVASLSVATSEKWKGKNGEYQEKTTWHKVNLWARKAEVAAEYLKKGSLVHVTGTIENRDWTDKDGNKRISTEIKGLTLTMLGDPDNRQDPLDSSDRANSAPTGNRPEKPNKAPEPKTAELPGNFDDLDDDLPF